MTEQKVLDLIAETLEIPVDSLDRSSVADHFPEWDSLGILNLTVVLRKSGIDVDYGNTAALRSVEGILGLCSDDDAESEAA